ncbi:GNAT family N-acetyltransferase [Granulicoccus phenolivorans]|uniref:GNAT family N-acetyltransferase n=1 Tax=Granulicoccus phenolivorans TaxID=266854 RepID=UPI000412D7F9|nr:GNAT family N-acetyltransferase [Granulicoccus phenolivorans]
MTVTATTPGPAEILARAFHHDPWMQFVEPSPSRRPALAAGVYAGMLNTGTAHGTNDITDGIGSATWLPRTRATTDLLDAFRTGLGQAALRLGPAALYRLLNTERFVESTANSVMAGREHIYLALLGVDPDHAHQGFGSRLVRTGLARADAAGLPVYLETFNPHNPGFYERFGFRVHRFVDRRGIPPFWAMVREPA